MTQQEENHRKIVMARDTRSEMGMAFAAREQPEIVEKQGCKICGQYGHKAAVCYEVIGYPPGWGTRGRGRDSRGARNSRGGRGGGRSRGYGRESAVAAIHQESSPIVGSGPNTATVPGRDDRAQIAFSVLSSKQVERLLNLLDIPKPGYEKLLGKDLWMLDSRASAHMVGNANLVHNLQKISSIAIGLPNGDYTVARDVGSVILEDVIKLDNELYVPNLNCNLVSISKLCKQLNCAVTYFDDFCVI